MLRLNFRRLASTSTRSIISASDSAVPAAATTNAPATTTIAAEVPAAATSPDSWTLADFKAHGLCSLSPSGLMEHSFVFTHTIAGLPWTASVLALGIALPLFNQVAFRSITRQEKFMQIMSQNVDDMRRYSALVAEVSQNGMRSAQLQKHQAFVQQYRDKNLPERAFGMSDMVEIMMPAFGFAACSHFFSSKDLSFADSAGLGLDLSVVDPSYAIVVPLVYYNYRLFKRIDVLTARYSNSAMRLLRVMLGIAPSTYALLGSFPLSTTVFAYAYMISHATVRKIVTSPQLAEKLGGVVPRVYSPEPRGFLKPISTWNAWKLALKA